MSNSQLLDVINKINNAKRFLERHFVERDSAINKLFLAFLSGEHMLLIGPTGAGKTAMFNAAASLFSDGEIWAGDLTKFTTNIDLFGPYDKMTLDQTGRLKHNIEGSIATAHFAHIGEFFDGSDPTLRTLLSLLNERRFKNGYEMVKSPLITAIADTNFRPEDMPSRVAQLTAIVDRFLFKEEVKYIEKNENLLSMLSDKDFSFSEQEKLSVQDLLKFINFIRSDDSAKMLDRVLLEAIIDLRNQINGMRTTQGRPPISDRTLVKSATLLKISAIMAGRDVANLTDLWSIKEILMTSLADEPFFKSAIEGSISTFSKRIVNLTAELEMEKVKVIMGAFQEIFSIVNSGTVTSAAELINQLPPDSLDGMITKGREAADSLIRFTSDSIEAVQFSRKSVEKIAEVVDQLIFAKINNISSLLDTLKVYSSRDAAFENLKQMRELQGAVMNITPTRECLAEHTLLLEKILVASADAEVYLTGRVK